MQTSETHTQCHLCGTFHYKSIRCPHCYPSGTPAELNAGIMAKLDEIIRLLEKVLER